MATGRRSRSIASSRRESASIRIATSLPEHMAIIDALEERNTELAEKRARDHTLGLAAYVETHGQELFT